MSGVLTAVDPVDGSLSRLTVTTGEGCRLNTLHLSPSSPVSREAASAGHTTTVLIRTPYGAHRLLGEARSWAAAGHQVFVQDVRGRHHSSGEWLPYAHEGTDGAATVRALVDAGMVPGPLLLAGSSYGAHAAIEAARALASQPPETRPHGVLAMVPALGLWESAHHPDGTPRLRDRIGWWLQHGLGRESAPPPPARLLDELCDRAAAVGTTELFSPHAPGTANASPAVRRWCAHPHLDALWRRLWAAPAPEVGQRWAGLRVPLQVVSGEHDFFAADARELACEWGGPASLLTGGWGHGLGTELSADHPVRQALRHHGGIFAQVLHWVRCITAGAREDERLRAWQSLDPDTGWVPITPRRTP